MGSRARQFREQQAAGAEAWARRGGSAGGESRGGGFFGAGGGRRRGGGGGRRYHEDYDEEPDHYRERGRNRRGGGDDGGGGGWGSFFSRWGNRGPRGGSAEPDYDDGDDGDDDNGAGRYDGGYDDGYDDYDEPPRRARRTRRPPPRRGDDPAAPAAGPANPWGPFANMRLTPTSIVKLIASLLIDAIGFATYLIPMLGEAGDAVWAPISGFLIFLLYGNIWLAGAGFVEEMLPGLDFIPTATLAWVAENTGLLQRGQQFSFLRNLYGMFTGGGAPR